MNESHKRFNGLSTEKLVSIDGFVVRFEMANIYKYSS